MDTGAQRTLIGLPKVKACCRFIRVKYMRNQSRNKVSFDSDNQSAMRSIPIRVPVGVSQFIVQHVDIVPMNIPFLTGLDIMTKYKMYIDTVRDKLCFPFLEMKVNLVRKMVIFIYHGTQNI